MEIKIIKTETEYKKAVKDLERIGDKSDFGDNPADVIKFESLSDIIKQYENKNHQLDVGDPIEIIKLKMEYMGLTRADLIPHIGSKGIISEVFNKKRSLSKSMIRNLSNLLGIDQSILNVDKETISPIKIQTHQNPVKSIFNFSNQMQKCVNEFQHSVIIRHSLFNVCAR